MTTTLAHSWAFSDEQRRRISEAAGREIEIVHLPREMPDDEQTPILERMEIFMGGIGPKRIEHTPNLKWVQLGSAGVTRQLEWLPEHLIITNASGVYGKPIAEHILSMMLAFARGLPTMIRGQTSKEWGGKTPQPRFELGGQTALLVGLGDIGSETAKRCHALGMHTVGIKRTVTADTLKPDYVDRLHAIDVLDKLLPQADHVVLSLPGTRHTWGMFDARRLARLKASAYIYNVGRGSIFDQPALVEALQAGKLAGAGLDVFDPEPLPADSPLWEMPHVIVSPHCSGNSPHYRDRMVDLLVANLPRYFAGEPMKSVVDRHWQY